MNATAHPSDVTLRGVTPPEFAELRSLASTIWLQHYEGIVSISQIQFMLADRFSDAALLASLQAADRWLEILRSSGVAVGYCSFQLTPVDAAESPAAAMKLGQLYVLASHRGRGLGRLMLAHVEARALHLGRDLLWLQVNKRNADALGFYRKTGFTVVRDAVFDIGSGFVMDDYVMQKPLRPRGC